VNARFTIYCHTNKVNGKQYMTPEARAERVRKINEGRRLARLKKVAGSQLLDAELLPFVRHWHLRGHSVESIASAFNVPSVEIERAVA
jgi:hypothetical protein